ncbi:MAG: lipopolysaccharide transport periplasmic protein LptA [Azoarcus sp.]|jgi:lipopolysaccharide export system protein LptA|nr:lipopolysaccharide transport periplasmic protein LptA [Azoarcus sp.]
MSTALAARGAPAAIPVSLFLAALLFAPASAPAQQGNSGQPVSIEADQVRVDDRNKIHVFEGNVVLTQGSLSIKGDKLVVTQDANGFQHGVATGGHGRLASFRQKRADSDVWVNGEAERIEYDGRNERARLFERAQVQSGGDKVSGQYIEYDAASENYLVTNAPGHVEPGGEKRVIVVIHSKDNGKTGKENSPAPEPGTGSGK